MNQLDVTYQNLLNDILTNGKQKMDRTGTGTIGVFGRQITHKMSEGFPLLTTKKMPFRSIVTELIWFLRGDTNIKYLVDNNCNIWTGDAYKNYMNKFATSSDITIAEFTRMIKDQPEFAKIWGELGPIYGKQWRNWESETVNYVGQKYQREPIDQIANLINDLKTNPNSRRLLVNAWNVAEIPQMVLPPCHYGFQLYTEELTPDERINLIGKYKDVPTHSISLMWNQRSVDTFLGLPFNIASYGLLLEILGRVVNMVPNELKASLGDTHLYLNHIVQAKEQMQRDSFNLPNLSFKDALSFTPESWSKTDFVLNNYWSHDKIEGKLSN